MEILAFCKMGTRSAKAARLLCTQCDVGTQTRNVPGVMLRSILTDLSGTQATEATAYVTGQESPISERWGGWYVTGAHGHTLHLGNELVHDKEHPETLNRAAGANLVDLSDRFDTSYYRVAIATSSRT